MNHVHCRLKLLYRTSYFFMNLNVVVTNDNLYTDMRQRFDDGEDPFDPEQQQQGFHGGPFAHIKYLQYTEMFSYVI